MGDQNPHDLLSDPTTLTRWLGWLKACAPMRDVSRRVLSRLLWAGTMQTFAPGQVLCAQGELAPVNPKGPKDPNPPKVPDPAIASAFFFILDGVTKVERDGVLVVELGQARTFGVEAVLGGQAYPATVTGVVAGSYLRFERSDVLALMDESASLRQSDQAPLMLGAPGVGGGVITGGASDATRWARSLTSAQVLRFETDLPSLPLEAMIDLLAQTVVADFPRDRVLVIYGTGTQWAGRLAPEQSWPGLDGVYRAVIDPRPAHGPIDFDYVFIVGEVAAMEGMELDMIVRISRGLPATLPSPDVHHPIVLPTVLIDSSAPKVESLTGLAMNHIGVHNPESAVWIKLEVERLNQAWQPGARASVLSQEMRVAMSRWARAVTDRRVGIALSGGGAWGFYHVAALKMLIAEKGVPIDVVTSASIGSAVGGYFCAKGLEGLEELVEFATRRFLNLDLAAAIAMITTASIEYGINWQLKSVQLNQLSTRFNPVATDLTTGTSYVVVGGNVGLAVRASASAPGLWGPTLLMVPQGPAHFVDGCVADNLPACLLPPLGADLTMAINCFPGGLRKTPPIRNRLQRFLRSINPVGRVVDLVVSGDLMLHASGDFEGQVADVLFCAGTDQHPLAGAMAFKDARRIISDAEQDEDLQAAVTQMSVKWEALKDRPHAGRDSGLGSSVSLGPSVISISPIPTHEVASGTAAGS